MRHIGGTNSNRFPDDQLKSTQQGAATSVLLALSPLLEGIGGRYFEDCNQAETIDHRSGRTRTPRGVTRYALDPASADRLWTVSEELLKAAQ